MKIIVLIVCLAIGETMAARRKRSSGGISIRIEQAPFFVLITRDGEDYCGGALITTRHVLTAAHCIVDASYARYPDLAVVSGTDKNYEGGTLHHIHDITIAPQYNAEYHRNDIGVIILSAHVKWSIKENFVALPTRGPKYHEHATFIALDTMEESNDVSLQELEVEMYRYNACWWYLPISVTNYYSNSFCGILGDGQSTQVGDSGGPLVYRRRIVGILSHHFKPNQRFNVFMDVYKFLTFIVEATRL